MMRRITIAVAFLGASFTLAFVAYSLVFALDGAPVESFRNVSPGMQPTLLKGEYFTISRRTLGVPHRRQLIAHAWPPDPSKQFVKRIVAVPGDTVAMVRGKLVLNGHTIDEAYAWHEEGELDPVSHDFARQRIGPTSRDTARNAARDNWGPLVVPVDRYFVLGDNRDNSLDSRYWGFVPIEHILGEVRRIYFSRDSTGHIRWSRLGHRVR